MTAKADLITYIETDDPAVLALARTRITYALDVRLGDQIARVGTVTEVSRFGAGIYIEGTRDMIVRLPDSRVTVTRPVTAREAGRIELDGALTECRACGAEVPVAVINGQVLADEHGTCPVTVLH